MHGAGSAEKFIPVGYAIPQIRRRASARIVRDLLAKLSDKSLKRRCPKEPGGSWSQSQGGKLQVTAPLWPERTTVHKGKD